MPEAPELEIIKRQLKKEIVGHRILKVYTGPPSLFAPSVSLFKEYLPGKHIKDVKRYGKLFVLLIDGEYNLGIHLGISGRILYVLNDKKINYEFLIEFENEMELLFQELKYGKITLFKDEELIKDLGPDVIDDKRFNIEYLKEVFKSKNKTIKPLLMDQKFVSGLGNTYTDEILYKTGIHPKRKAKTLSDKEIESLYMNIKKVIDEAISLGGNSYEGFVDIYGNRGRVEDKLIVVHHRAGAPCPVCSTKIEKIKLNGRDTYFCPKCQI